MVLGHASLKGKCIFYTGTVNFESSNKIVKKRYKICHWTVIEYILQDLLKYVLAQIKKIMFMCIRFPDPTQVFVPTLNILLWNRGKILSNILENGENAVP